MTDAAKIINDFFGGSKKPNNEGDNLICQVCAESKGRFRTHSRATWHVGKCPYCNVESYLTQLRDYQ